MEKETPKAQTIKFSCSKADQHRTLVDLIEEKSTLSKSLIKKIMIYGGVYKVQPNKKRKRIRKAKTLAEAGDNIECYFDPKISLDQEFEFPVLLATKKYGVYLKPAGALSQGTNYGDRSSLIRTVEKERTKAYLVNRLDRETEGLVIVAYDAKTQQKFQEIWKEKVTKRYQAIVKGEWSGSGIIKAKVEGKKSETHYEVIKTEDGFSYVDVKIITGRKHQIRIHFADQGFPVMGDPKYGENNKNKDGMKLLAYQLEFEDPYSKKEITVTIPKGRFLF